MTSHELLQEQALLLPIDVQYQNCPQDGVSCFVENHGRLNVHLNSSFSFARSRLRYIIGYAHWKGHNTTYHEKLNS